MTSTGKNLLTALGLLPSTLEPGDEAPNFFDLKHRINEIDRQVLVVNLQAWVEDNAP